MSTVDVDELQGKAICTGCIGESYLCRIVEAEGEERECSYCGNTGPTILLEEMSDRVKCAFGSHFSRTATEPNPWQYAMLKDKESDYEWDREGEPTVYAIMNAADIPEEAARDIQAILEETHRDFDESAMGEEGEFSSDAYYEEIMPDDEEWQEGWRQFERTIKSEARFFSRTAVAQLRGLFDTIDEMRTSQGKPLITDAGPGTDLTHLYRARVFQSDSKLESALKRPDLELSAPPSAFASSGRMNARGISVFYGANEVNVALAEVRPPVGSQVAVARFEIIRPIRLLDLMALGEIQEKGSFFDPDYASRLGRMTFLQRLSARIARPVMPDDQESEYLPTQAIADFLATEGKVPLDGILFPSVQVNDLGLNAVLFHKAAKCAKIELPDGTTLIASTHTNYEDGPEPDYIVWEDVPSEKEEAADERPSDPFSFTVPQTDDWTSFDDREDTLRVDLDYVWVHLINAVRFDTRDFKVTRHRSTKSEIPF